MLDKRFRNTLIEIESTVQRINAREETAKCPYWKMLKRLDTMSGNNITDNNDKQSSNRVDISIQMISE